MGSVHYLPPEQASGKGSTIRSDIYSLGILMFEMLTGKVPFNGDSAVEIALKHMKDPLPSVREINPVVPQSVENIILKAAAKNPKNRYHDVRQMAEDIKTCLDEERQNEEKITFKYPETDFSDTRKIDSLKEEKRETKDEKPVARQIDEDEKINKSNKNKITLISSIIAVFVITLFLVIIVIPKLSSSKEVKVPDVYGMEISKAEDMIRKSGLKIESKEKASDDVSENLVIETSPSKNRYVKEGSKVIIYYSSGSKKIEIEDYVGKNAYEIKAKLELLGISVIIEEKEVTDSVKYEGKEQLIIEQSVSKGEKLAPGERLTLYIPKILSTYPDMVEESWTLDRVEEFCKKYGLTLQTPSYKETDEVEEGIVLAQSPKAGEEIFEKDKVKIVLSKKPTTTTKETTTTNDNLDDNLKEE